MIANVNNGPVSPILIAWASDANRAQWLVRWRAVRCSARAA